ncbi:MAG: hypothetical protein ABI550_03545 [Ignavibacteriaceae bacterium]
MKTNIKKIKNLKKLLIFIVICSFKLSFAQELQPLVPLELRGDDQYKREGTHDANNIRTVFWNYGMVGDYPADPINVDLTVFHSVEVPKGSNENYSDGTTPFVLTQITQENGQIAYIMETGYRERQGGSPNFNRVMRFEPRPGYFQLDPNMIQVGKVHGTDILVKRPALIKKVILFMMINIMMHGSISLTAGMPVRIL